MRPGDRLEHVLCEGPHVAVPSRRPRELAETYKSFYAGRLHAEMEPDREEDVEAEPPSGVSLEDKPDAVRSANCYKGVGNG
mmetsp:Transcript_2301/g.4338  ORF Transcript_2301/g.4338 Transcript_2301/m.4338 type:complete len:81 (+) Transcript_2301:397-639(+)